MTRRALVHLYPRGWRQRYGEEFLAMLEAGPLSPAGVVNVIRGAVDARVRPGAWKEGSTMSETRRVPATTWAALATLALPAGMLLSITIQRLVSSIVHGHEGSYESLMGFFRLPGVYAATKWGPYVACAISVAAMVRVGVRHERGTYSGTIRVSPGLLPTVILAAGVLLPFVNSDFL